MVGVGGIDPKAEELEMWYYDSGPMCKRPSVRSLRDFFLLSSTFPPLCFPAKSGAVWSRGVEVKDALRDQID